MKLTPFAKELRKWRGKRLQKEISEVIGVNQRTYEGWENGRPPSRYSINEIKRLMASNPETHPH